MNNRAKKLRRQAGYEDSVPRCDICIHYQGKRKRVGADGQTHRHPPLCTKHKFTVSGAGVCDDWTDKNGDTVE